MNKKFISLIIVLFSISLLFSSCLMMSSYAPMAPYDYTESVKTGGEVEAKYLAMGNYSVDLVTRKGSEITKKFYIYYPKELMNSNSKFSVIVMLNGTGVLPSQYKTVFEHLASWGFIVIGSDDGSCGFGNSADECIDLIFNENLDSKSIFYEKMDTENIGITGHSQGGAGVLAALSVMNNKDCYKTAVVLSPVHEEMSYELGWNYDLTNIQTPIFLLAGTEGKFETETVIPIDKMKEMFEKIPARKSMARKVGMEHGHMLYSADGYVTAWFMWLLKGDENAAKAFWGENPELSTNKLYSDQNLKL